VHAQNEAVTGSPLVKLSRWLALESRTVLEIRALLNAVAKLNV